jgi:hypothetical protein
MSAISSSDVQRVVREFVASEIECEPLDDGSSRVGCVMPLEYANNDSVVVWVELWGDRFTISDYGDAFQAVAARISRDIADFSAEAEQVCRPLGVKVRDRALFADATREELGEAVWRVATAAHDVAELAVGFRKPRGVSGERYFVSEVEHELRNRAVFVEREVELAGSSGHKHRATLFVPAREAVVEPIQAAAHYNTISAVYAKFGDLSHANGYQRLALVDDRHERLSQDLAAMLVQVSDVVSWTRLDEWISRLR